MARVTFPSRRWPWAFAVLGLVAAAVAVLLALRAHQRRLDAARPPLPILRFVEGRWQVVHPDPRRGVPPAGLIRVTGRVIEAFTGDGLGGVEVVYTGDSGEGTTSTDADGRYAIDVAPGFYRAFVRAEGVISVGTPPYERLPAPPSPREAGSPDDQLAPEVGVFHDQSGVDLEVLRGGVVEGRVFDRAGRPVAGAMVRIRADLRPVLGTDVAETGIDGAFHLEAPVGYWPVEAFHDGFAGVDPALETRVEIAPGHVATLDLTLTEGCIVRGRVVRADGSPAGDGAIERRGASGTWTPDARISADGTFRWATTDSGEVSLRGWPWKAPPSPPRAFTCAPGVRIPDVVFELPADPPALAGTIVTADGQPAAGAFLDIFALSPGGADQQERADDQGRWEVFALPPGEYAITASVDGGGIVEQQVTVPGDNVALVLGGTGSLAGAVTGVESGSMVLELDGCHARRGEVVMPRTRRVIAVRGGQYQVDRLPACATSAVFRLGRRVRIKRVAIVAGDVVTADIDLSTPTRKRVYGTVRGPDGRPVSGVGYVVPMDEPDQPGVRFEIAVDGSYQVEAAAGDVLEIEAVVGDQRVAGAARVGTDDAGEERVDVTLAPRGPDDEPPAGDDDDQ